MKEIREIISAYDIAISKGQRVTLATVVHVEGSSYRRPGARMLVTEEGQLTGAISGGCLEGDALRKALHVMEGNRNMLVTYDTNDEDDAKLGMGLGCNGIIQVLFEPIDSNKESNPIELLKEVAGQREKAVLATLFSLDDKKAKQPGTCLLLKQNIIKANEHVIHKELLVADAEKVMDEQTSVFNNYEFEGRNLTAFIEFVKPPISLVIAGAGNDVLPIVDMAVVLGWDVSVFDGRTNYAKKERFPDCQVMLAKPEEVLEEISIDQQTVFALMTHNYNYDLALLRELVARNAVYIGLLGPRKKRDRIIEELKQNGLELTEQQLASIHGPVGLDIGAETSEEIALSILAEINAVLNKREGKRLKDREGTIHDPSTSMPNE